MIWTLLDLALWFIYFCVMGLASYVMLILLRKYAPDWLRNSELGNDLGLKTPENN